MGGSVWSLSALAQQTLVASHAIAVRATAYTAVGGMVSDLPISGGSVTVDATSQVRRTATVEIADPALWPVDPTDILSPFGAELLVEYGIVLPGVGTEWVPLIQAVIAKTKRTRPSGSSAPVTLDLTDRSAKIAEDRLDSPTQVGGGSTTVVAAITALIQATLPTAVVTDQTGSTQVAPTLDIERERWADGIEKLADAIGAEVFCDPTGVFIIRPQPVLAGSPDWVVASGPRGVLVSRDEEATRERVYNRVVASGQRSDGTAPVWAGVSDTDASSPTVYGGAFGRKPRFYTSPLLTTTAQATTTATALLARGKGMQGSVTLSTLVNPALDVGDTIRLQDRDTVQLHIIDRVSIPLRPGEAQQIQTRSLDLLPES